MFRVIREAEENPSDLLNSYRQQNIIMQKMRMLHTAFDGIKINHWSDTDRELPDILAGSICEFEGRLFETNETIKLSDSSSSKGSRFIKLVIVRDANDSNNDYLEVQVVSNNFPSYDYNNRGFYHLDSQGRCLDKYLRLSMKYSSASGGYVEKKYWNINDFQRKGLILKRKTVSFGVGTHEFTFPSDVNSITVHICSGGGGGGILSTLTQGTGVAGRASGQGKLYNGSAGSKGSPGRGGVLNNQSLASGGNGGDGKTHNIGNKGSIGGGSGSAAIVDINRSMLGTSSKIKIIVGAGGVSGYMDGNPTRMNNGQNGSAVIEYMQK